MRLGLLVLPLGGRRNANLPSLLHSCSSAAVIMRHRDNVGDDGRGGAAAAGGSR